LCKASSAGSVFNERIKGRYEFRFDPDRRRFGPKAWRSRNRDPALRTFRP
jgi:hypothetical protein